MLKFNSIAVATMLFSVQPIYAQIKPSHSPTMEQSRVIYEGDSFNNSPGDLIVDGAQRGSNLFHRFSLFNIEENQRVYFNSQQGITSIFSVVVGNEPSNILGSLGVWDVLNNQVGQTNLFLLNPNGIVFGPGAMLDLRGSFVASTATSILFSDGFSFSAQHSPTIPLLTVSTPIGLQFGVNNASIVNQANSLRLPSSQTLALVGGRVSLQGGNTIASPLDGPAGRIEIGGVGANEQVQVDLQADQGLVIGYEGVKTFEDIQLTPLATVSASNRGFRSGDIHIRGRNIFLEAAQILSINQSSQPGGMIDIKASESLDIGGEESIMFGPFNLLITGAIFTRSLGDGSSGDINIFAKTLKLDGGAGIISQAVQNSVGSAGNVHIVASESAMFSGVDTRNRSTTTSTQTFGSGNAGNLRIETPKLTVENGAIIGASTDSSGRSGNLSIQASEIAITGFSIENGRSSAIQVVTGSNATNPLSSQLIIDTDSLSIDNGAILSTLNNSEFVGANIIINAESVNLSTGGQILSTAFNQGNAGGLTITTNQNIHLSGRDPNFESRISQFGSGSVSNDGPASGLYARAEGIGQAGTINIITNELDVQNGARISASNTDGPGGSINAKVNALTVNTGGQLVTTTIGSQAAGNINLEVFDRIDLSGQDSGLLASTAPSSSGNGGSIIIDPPLVLIRDQARIGVDSQGSGSAGRIELQAETLVLENNALISAATTSGQGGDIRLTVTELLQLQNGSQITATAGQEGGNGDGGNITLPAQFIIADINGNNQISANAFSGTGGNISINTAGIFGFQLGSVPSSSNNITASSELGLEGMVSINNPEIDPAQGLVNFPVAITDPTRLVSQTCSNYTELVDNQKNFRSQFIITERGGLSINPKSLLSNNAVSSTWVIPEPLTHKSRSANQIRDLSDKRFDKYLEVTEAQKWEIDLKGQLTLVAKSSVRTSLASNNLGSGCKRF